MAEEQDVPQTKLTEKSLVSIQLVILLAALFIWLVRLGARVDHVEEVIAEGRAERKAQTRELQVQTGDLDRRMNYLEYQNGSAPKKRKSGD